MARLDFTDSWLGASYTLSQLTDGRVETIEQQNQSELTSLCANREGGAWFGTEGDGLHLVKERLVRTFTTQDGLAGNDIRSLSQAPNGDIWATSDFGLSRYRSGKWEVQGNLRSPLRSVNVDEAGHPWFSKAQSGPEALRKDSFTTTGNRVLPGLDWQDPNTLRFLRDGLWVVCERGVTWLKPNSLTLNADDDWIPDFTDSGLAFGRYGTESLRPGMVPLGLVEDHDGFLWVGSHHGNGVVRLNRNGKGDIFGETNGVPGQKTVPVLCDSSGSLWIVSDAGLTRRKNGVFQTLTEHDGLPRDNFLDMVEDDLGSFWISGKRGIHRVSRADVERFFSGETNRILS